MSPSNVSLPLRSSAAAGRAPLGLPFLLLPLWLCFEFGRPPNPMGIPLLLSGALFVWWAVTKDKQWAPYSWWWLVLLGVMVIGVPFATNSYSAFWATREMVVLFLCICLPLQAFLTNERQVRFWIYTFVLVALYVGAWAATHGGYGPAGRDGGQDENYVAALMGLAVALAYFCFFADRRVIVRAVLVGGIIVFVAAIALGANPSRGGFLGLCAVGGYCLSRSPRKSLGLAIFAAVAIAFVLIAGPAFWAEIETTTDYSSGTGDIRLEIWKAGLRMWEHNPIFGVGAGNFRWALGDYQTPAQVAKFGRSLAGSIIAHSLWVEMLAEVGTAGVIATGILVVRTWTGLGKMRDEILAGAKPIARELNALACYADAIRAGIIAILVNGLFLSLYYYSHLWLLLATGTALPFVYRRLRSGESRSAPAPHAVAPVPATRGTGPRRAVPSRIRTSR